MANNFQQLDSYKAAQQLLEDCDKRTLITFDIDETLITSRDVLPAFCYGRLPFTLRLIAAFKYPSLLFNTNKLEWCTSTMNKQTEPFVFDSDIVHIIRQLNLKGCAPIALTFAGSGSYGIIKNFPEWRTTILKNFGFDFSDQFHDTTFTSLPMYRGTHPVLHKGILFTNCTDKGLTLAAFLEHYNLKPARIISFDDSYTFLTSIARACSYKKIPFTGYQVLGAKKLLGTWNMRRALLQIDYVMKHERWLSDQEADALLARTKTF